MVAEVAVEQQWIRFEFGIGEDKRESLERSELRGEEEASHAHFAKTAQVGSLVVVDNHVGRGTIVRHRLGMDAMGRNHLGIGRVVKIRTAIVDRHLDGALVAMVFEKARQFAEDAGCIAHVDVVRSHGGELVVLGAGLDTAETASKHPESQADDASGGGSDEARILMRRCSFEALDVADSHQIGAAGSGLGLDDFACQHCIFLR